MTLAELNAPDRAAFAAAVGDESRRLVPLRVHPELAGRATLRHELTADSTSEQPGAGLTRSSPERLSRHPRARVTQRRTPPAIAFPISPLLLYPFPSLTRFRRNALVTTETELSAMAAPAKTGDSSTPRAG